MGNPPLLFAIERVELGGERPEAGVSSQVEWKGHG